MLSQIMALVQQAQLQRAPVQRVADLVAQRFVPAVVGLSLVTWMVWYVLVYSFQAGVWGVFEAFSRRFASFPHGLGSRTRRRSPWIRS